MRIEQNWKVEQPQDGHERRQREETRVTDVHQERNDQNGEVLADAGGESEDGSRSNDGSRQTELHRVHGAGDRH